MFCLNDRLVRNILRDNNAVGFVDPGRELSRGNIPSPLNSIAMGMFPAVSKIPRLGYHLMGYLVVASQLLSI